MTKDRQRPGELGGGGGACGSERNKMRKRSQRLDQGHQVNSGTRSVQMGGLAHGQGKEEDQDVRVRSP